MDCEKATVLIATNHVRRIEELVEVEIGSKVFQVYAKEIGFNDGTTYPLCNNGKEVLEVTDESTGVSKSGAEERMDVESVDRNQLGTEVEALQPLWAGRNCINDNAREREAVEEQSNLMGGEPNAVSGLNGVEIGTGDTRNRDGETEGKGVTEEANNAIPSQEQLGGELGRVSTMEQGPEYQLISDVLCQSGPQSLRAGAGPDACSLGFLGIDDYLGGADLPLLHNQKVLWVDVVSGIGNSGLLVSKGPDEGKVAERGSDKDYVVDSDKDWARRSCPNHHGRGMDEFGHGRVACLTRIGNRLVKPATVMEGSATLVRVALQGDKGKPNFYDVNLVDGYKSITF
ncbi:hypothetical protein V6N11_031962 [Hibiscus sabdariffa]|uniref:Uncharacterized protein n=1 Tax=Hibiscus sabdariffa TaxID=183260 RepID=A0ABR2SZ75_9ROSI